MTSNRMLALAAAGATLALGLAFTSASSAQTYYGDEDAAPTAGEIIVQAPYRHEHTTSGAEIDRVYASRVVDISDLDLSTRSGVRELRYRVSNAAADACQQLDDQAAAGHYSVDSNSDCESRAIDRAMRDAPIERDVDYNGY